MIPIKLKLRNFMAYREAALDFQGIHLAVLTGENGAGKSSLLDAITWTLWGKARAKRDDELIHLGQSEMEAEFVFDLGGSVYQVIRKRDSSRRGRSDLSFHMEEAGGWRTLTDTSLRATQKKIDDLMRLDYDTFINSAFLLQGRADEFTTKPPGKRKEILSDILGLGIYDIYEERAKKRAVDKERGATAVMAKIEQIEQELAKEFEYRSQLAEAQKVAAELHQGLELAEAEEKLLREQHRSINDKQRQLEDLSRRLAGAETDLKDITEAMAAAQASLAHYQTVLDRRSEIEAGLAELAQARETVKDWERRLQESARLSDRKHDLDAAFNQAKAGLEADLREINTKIGMLTPKVEAIEAQQAQLDETQAELAKLQALAASRETQQTQLTHLKEESARLAEQNKQLKLEMDDIKDKLEQLQEAGSNCPVCRRPLEPDHQAEVLAQFQQEGKIKGDTYRANQTRLKEIGGEQQQLQQSLVEAEKQLRALPGVQGKAASLTQWLNEAEIAGQELSRARQNQADLQKQLDRQEFAPDVIAALDEVKAELAQLGYDEAAHRQARTEVDRLTHFEAGGRELAEAEKRIKEEQKRLEKEQARHQRLLEQTAADRARVTELEQETAGLADLTARLNTASAEVDRLQREDRLARDNVVRFEQLLHYLTARAKERGELETKLEQIRHEQGIYRELQTAFGKKGIQALLIESAIPEVEDEANKLLTRMTDGRMHIRFETQREAKTGDSTIETLDIRIADEIGTRDYEMYSGGEAFRVNFAIRVALSKVLARRAGARLQTLVIDEGFGTQDGPGRERLVEAITIIQQEFEKIIVITHLDELKDAFPVQIDVWKTSAGSQVAIR